MARALGVSVRVDLVVQADQVQVDRAQVDRAQVDEVQADQAQEVQADQVVLHRRLRLSSGR